MTALDLKARRRLRKEAGAALAGLGDTVDLIAGSLLNLGITGVRDRASCCPIANFLVKHMAGVEAASVSVETVTLWVAGPTIVEVDTPPAVAAFMDAFDLGHFDDLAAPPAEGGGER